MDRAGDRTTPPDVATRECSRRGGPLLARWLEMSALDTFGNELRNCRSSPRARLDDRGAVPEGFSSWCPAARTRWTLRGRLAATVVLRNGVRGSRPPPWMERL